MKTIILAKNGTPLDQNDWTEEDWIDLHKAVKRLIKRIAKRHKATPINSLNPPTGDGKEMGL